MEQENKTEEWVKNFEEATGCLVALLAAFLIVG